MSEILELFEPFEPFKEILWVVLGMAITSSWNWVKKTSKRTYYRLRSKKIIYKTDKYKFLIFTAGFKFDLQRYIIEEVNPEYVGILTSETNRENVENFEEGYGKKIKFKNEYVSEFDIHELKTKCDLLLDWSYKLGVTKKDIAIDCTGGTVPYSIAVYESSRINGIDLIYTKSKYEDGKMLKNTQESILIGNIDELHKINN